MIKLSRVFVKVDDGFACPVYVFPTEMDEETRRAHRGMYNLTDKRLKYMREHPGYVVDEVEGAAIIIRLERPMGAFTSLKRVQEELVHLRETNNVNEFNLFEVQYISVDAGI